MKKTFFLQALTLGIAVCIASASHTQSLVSTGKTVTVSSTENASYPGSNAVDGSLSTFWSSASTNYNQWLYVDLGTGYDISKVQITFADGRYATTLDLMFSDDASTWSTIRTIPNGNTSSIVTFAGLSGVARYVKFNGRGRANPSGYRISDFKIWASAPTTSAQLSEITTVLNRFIAFYSGKETADLSAYVNGMQSNGQFSNIDYSGTGWTRHALYLNRMAQAYTTPSNLFYQDPQIPAKVMLGMRHLLNVHYTSTNWHDTVVRVPNNLATALVLMKSLIPRDSTLLYSELLLDHTDNAGHKGTNRAWVSGILVRKGLITERYPVANKGYLNIVKGLDITAISDNEGVMIDNSFHQHHDQLYTGGYGKALIGDEVTYLRMARSTSFESAYTTTYRDNLANLMLGGLQVIGYRGSVDFGSAGRGVTAVGNLATIGTAVLDTQKLNDPTRATAYDNWKTHINGGAYLASPGTKYFWKSSILTSHGSNFYMSAKVISTRTEGTEQLNGENLKGYNLPLGATNIMTTGTEYFDIFPTWHWARIPGTTSENSEDPAVVTNGFTGGYLTGTNSFGGGVSWSDDGIIAYEHNYKGISAKKAYFLMENMMVCMGNSITGTKSNEVVTTVNQTKSVGPITYNSPSTTLTVDSISSNTLQWVHHNNVGYLFPQGGYMSLTNKTQTGTWRSINNGGSTSVQSNLMFNLYVRHSPTPLNRTYYYIVAPDKQASDMTTLASSHGFVNVINNSSIQAIRNTINTKYAVVFYAPGQVDMGDGLIVKSNKKAIVFIKKYSTNYRVSVADPMYTESSIVITLNKQLSGSGTVFSNGETAITFTMPSGDMTGSTANGFYTIVSGARIASDPQQQPAGAIDETRESNVVLYPNPTTSMLKIGGISNNAVIEVYNQSGRSCKTAKGNSIDVSGLVAGGSYLIRISDGGSVITKQFIKQ